jgi:hypothetical protein
VIAHSIHLCIPSQPIRNLEQHKIARKIRRSYQDPYRLQHRVCARDHLCKRSRKVRILGFYDMEDGKGHTDNIRKNAILVAMLPHLADVVVAAADVVDVDVVDVDEIDVDVDEIDDDVDETKPNAEHAVGN